MRLVAQTPQSPPKDAAPPPPNYQSPVRTRTITDHFFGHRRRQAQRKKFLTLQEALEQKKLSFMKPATSSAHHRESLPKQSRLDRESGFGKGADFIFLRRARALGEARTKRSIVRGLSRIIAASNDLRLASKYKKAKARFGREWPKCKAAGRQRRAPQSWRGVRLQFATDARAQESARVHRWLHESLGRPPKDKKDTIGYVMAINASGLRRRVRVAGSLLEAMAKDGEGLRREAFPELQKDKKFTPPTVRCRESLHAIPRKERRRTRTSTSASG